MYQVLVDFEKKMKAAFNEWEKDNREKSLQKLLEVNSLIENNMMGGIEKFLTDIKRPTFTITPELDDDLFLVHQLTDGKLFDITIAKQDTEQELKVDGYFYINESMPEWFTDHGGIDAVRKWRQFTKCEDYEKEHFPEASKFKQTCIYILDNCEQLLEQNGSANSQDKIGNEDITNLFNKFITENKQLVTNKYVETHFFMQMLQYDYPMAREAMARGIAAKIIEFKDNKFNFICDKGCVGKVFRDSGCTCYKMINQHILINGEAPKENTLKNGAKNPDTKAWDTFKLIFFPTPKLTPKKNPKRTRKGL